MSSPSRPDPLAPRESPWRVALPFLKVGAVAFGGPPAHLALLEEEFVQRRGWLARARFIEAMGVWNLFPGPLTTQTAIYLGWVRAGRAGAVLAGLAFLLPGFVAVTLLAAAYAAVGRVPGIQDLFAGMAPAAVGVIAAAGVRLWGSLRAKRRNWLWVALAAATALWLPGAEIPVLLACGLVSLAWTRALARRQRLHALEPTLALSLLVTFLQAGALVFGGGYVIVPLLQYEVVEVHRWLSARQFLDGLALTQLAPGPVINFSAFVGYFAAGTAGAALAAAAVFLPSFVFVLVFAPSIERVREKPTVRAFLSGVGPAAVGLIFGSALLLAQTVVVHPAGAFLALGAFLAVVVWRVPPWLVILVGALLGAATTAPGVI